MKKLAFIPTREQKNYPITSYLEGAGFEVHLLVNKKSIFAAYTEALEEFSVKPDDIVILCHDDIQVLTDKSIFNMILETKLEDKNIGFVGVAGTQLFLRSGVWWEASAHIGIRHALNPLRGCVFHGDSILDLHPTFYGSFGPVVVMDGLFLAAKGRTLLTIGLSQPDYLPGPWDFYDILYTFKAFKRGLTNLVVPIQILHQSHGEGISNDSWTVNREAFVTKFTDHLPASTG